MELCFSNSDTDIIISCTRASACTGGWGPGRGGGVRTKLLLPNSLFRVILALYKAGSPFHNPVQATKKLYVKRQNKCTDKERLVDIIKEKLI